MRIKLAGSIFMILSALALVACPGGKKNSGYQTTVPAPQSALPDIGTH